MQQKRRSSATNSKKFEEKLMKQAIELAEKAVNPSPNPKVGALVVKDGKVIGAGFHEQVGNAHAEIVALRQAGKRANGATIFLTLEPCNHTGKTPPCSKAIVKAGVEKVVIGARDLSKAKGGVDFLKKNGVKVKTGVLKKECEELNQIWLKNTKKQLPYLVLKLALDENGGTIPQKGKWITSAASRKEVMHLRRNFDAIMVGVNTIVADNPRLTVRGLKVAKQPLRVVLDGSGRIPKNAKVLRDGGKTLVVGKTSPKALLRKLYKMGITSIFLEGGETTAKKFLNEKLVDRVWIFQKKAKRTPKVCGKKLPLKKMRKFGEDTLFEAVLKQY